MEKNEEKVLNSIAKATFENVDLPQEQFDMIQKINTIYHNTLEKYMNSKPVVEFNFLEWLKTQTVGITTKEEMKSLILTVIETIKTKENRTKIENYELSLARKIYRDVVLGNGKNYEYNEISVNYDDQVVKFSPFELNQDVKLIQ